MKPVLIDSFKGYKFKKFTQDFMSGVLVAIVALPLSIALGIQSGVTLQRGIITAIVAGFFIAILGGCKFQIGGPTAAFSVIIANYIADPAIGLLGVQIATIMAGVILIIMGITRVGKVIKYIPYPIVVAYTTGVGVSIFIGQLGSFLAVNLPVDYTHDFFSVFYGYIANISLISVPTLLLGFFTVFLIVLLPRINKKLPASFIALIVCSAIGFLINKFSDIQIATIGSTFSSVSAGFDFPNFFNIKNINIAKLIVPAFVFAFLGSVESLLSATVADGMTNTKHDSNQELVGQGIANIASSLCGGLPATGAIARTAANIKAGAQSPLSGMVHSLTLMIMFFALMPLVAYIPMTCLAAVLITVAVSMSNFKLFLKMAFFNVKDLIILITTFVLTVGKDLVFGILGGLSVAIMLMAIDIFSKTSFLKIEYPSIYSKGIEGFLLADATFIKINGNLTFAKADKLIEYSLANAQNCIALDFENVKRADLSCMQKIAKFSDTLDKSNRKLYVINANITILKQYKRALNL